MYFLRLTGMVVTVLLQASLFRVIIQLAEENHGVDHLHRLYPTAWKETRYFSSPPKASLITYKSSRSGYAGNLSGPDGPTNHTWGLFHHPHRLQDQAESRGAKFQSTKHKTAKASDLKNTTVNAATKAKKSDDIVKHQLVGFYNIFRQDKRHFKGIITEQIRLLKFSGLAAASQAINVVFAGSNHRSFRVPTRSSKFVLASSKSSGDEKDTLQLLYNHCVASPRDKVFYIHSKGTFHPSASNDMPSVGEQRHAARQNLTKAVVACW